MSPHALDLPDTRRWSEDEDVQEADDEGEEDDAQRDEEPKSPRKRSPQADEWVPVEVTFGMPLFDPELNRAVCERIEFFQLFSEDNLANFTKHSQHLSNALLDFIEAHQAAHYKYEVEPGQVPPPTKTLSFPGNSKY